VHGSLDTATNTITATRIEVKAAPSAAFTGIFRIRGLLDAKAGTIGGTSVDLSGVSTAGLDGLLVRATLDTSAKPKVLTLTSGAAKVAEHKGKSAELEGNADGVKVEANGDVSFTINGAAVRVTSSTSLSPASAKLSGIVSGVRVEAEGVVDATSGVLVASKLKFKKADDDGAQVVELHGAITGYDAVAGTFTLRGETVSIGASTFANAVSGFATLADFEAALLNTSNKFMVIGTRIAGGTKVLATLIKIDTNTLAPTLANIIASKGSITAGDLVFDGFAIGTSPLLSPQGALVEGGGLDILVDTTTNASGQTVLRLTQINPATQLPQPLTVDLSQVGAKDLLRNITFTVTVKNPALRLVSVTQSVGTGTTAQGEVTGSVFTYAMLPLAAQVDFYNFAQFPPVVSANSPDLPNGRVSSEVFDTAWLLTTAHAQGKTPVGSASLDKIELAFTTGTP
jgi:hypothetical protein